MPKGYAVSIPPPNPSGLCMCDCKGITPLARQSDLKTGNVKGEHIRYIHNHHGRQALRYIEKDQGYATPCWVWQLSLDEDGYGNAWDGPVKISAHRLSYQKAKGPIPDGLQLDHLCHNPANCPGGRTCPHRACINPDHFEPKTGRANTQRVGNAKLTVNDVPSIKAMRERGMTFAVIAEHFGVCAMTIHKVVSGKGWKETGTP